MDNITLIIYAIVERKSSFVLSKFVGLISLEKKAITSTQNKTNFVLTSDLLLINGEKIIENAVYRDKLMKIQGKVIAFQSNSLRVLSAKLNKHQNVKIAGMIQKLVGTELRHELEGFALDVMGELGTLYENSPNLKDGGSWQIGYMYFLGLIIGGGTSQIQKNIISERGLGMPKEPKVQQGG